MNKHKSLLLGGALAASLLLGACSSTEPKSVTSADASPARPTNSASSNPSSMPANTGSPMSGVQVASTAKSVYFDFDSAEIRSQDGTVLRSDAELAAKGAQPIRVEGNCDERGSREYNIALGNKRAEAVKRALTVLGVKADRIEAISYGNEKPKANGHDESAWAENRRADVVLR